MKISERIFDRCLLIELSTRNDTRGSMEISYNEAEIKDLTGGFVIKEQRIYRMPSKRTFFGIHFQEGDPPQAKLVSVLQGRGLDYIIDLRHDSVTYKQYHVTELCGNVPEAIYIPSGFGHAFLSLEDDTVQLFCLDEYFRTELSGIINYKDPGIGLKLPFDDLIIAEKDRQAGYTGK